MKLKKAISKILIALFTLSILTSISTQKAYADAFKIVTLGADLTPQQKEDMLKYFGATKETSNVLEVTREEEAKYLGNVASKQQLGTKSISCSYVEPTTEGGLNISTHNIYWVTDSMIRNALITAGIENANVKVSAPFNVSGTAALTGILKGFENSSNGKKIDENKKEAANQEIVVTGELGEKIGQDKAASLVNEVKKEVIKEKPKNEKEIENIIEDVTNNYDQKLSDEDMKNLTALMTKINDLDLNFKQLKGQLNDVSDKLKHTLTSEEAQGFFDKIGSFFSNVWDGICDFFSGSSDDSTKESTSNTNLQTTDNSTTTTNTSTTSN